MALPISVSCHTIRGWWPRRTSVRSRCLCPGASRSPATGSPPSGCAATCSSVFTSYQMRRSCAALVSKNATDYSPAPCFLG